MSHTSTRDPDGVQAVLDGVRRVVQGLHESSRDSERRCGLSTAQLFVLQRLAQAAPASINELAARTHTHQSSVSVVISRLVDRGLVRRATDPADRRRRLLTLTAAGRRRLRSAPALTQDRLIAAVLRLSPATRRTVARALDGMAGAMRVRGAPAMFFESGKPV
ncbi:MAG: MarR family transcriptional regulator [Vicinamibacterales bacterium]